MEELIKKELEFCKEIDCEEGEHGFIYQSKNGKSIMNLPYVLLEYKQWLIAYKIVNANLTLSSTNNKEKP